MRSNVNRILLAEALKKRRRMPKLASIQPPSALERQYFNDIKKILADIYDAYDKILDQMEAPAAKLEKSLPAGSRQDAGEREIASMLNRVRVVLGNKYTQQELEKVINKNLNSVKRYNNGKNKDLFKRVAGVDLFMDDAPLETLMNMATMDNVNLITTLIGDVEKKVENTIFSGFRAGLRHEEIAKDVRKYLNPNAKDSLGRSQNVVYKAQFIARDQVAKLNSQISQSRQSELGIKRYVWRTSGDERVRDSHKKKEGKIYRWSDPPEDTGHPGEDFQCRCTAEPVIDDILD
jgi:SPP1 gp7 family putative phage head morphogenesis protein